MAEILKLTNLGFGWNTSLSDTCKMARRTYGFDPAYPIDDTGYLAVRPVAVSERFGCEESEPVVLTQTEQEIASIWKELEEVRKTAIEKPVAGGQTENVVQSLAEKCTTDGHDFHLDIEIGLLCIHCGFVRTEIRHLDIAISPVKRVRRKLKKMKRTRRSSH